MSLIISQPINSIAFHIFNYPVKYYGLLLTLAIFVGLVVSYFLLKKRFNIILAQDFVDISPFMILISLIGARFFYVLGDWEFYSLYPREIFFINHGGLSIYGAIFSGIIFFIFYCKRRNISFFSFCDCLAVVMPICQSIGRWGNYFNQEAFGTPTEGFIKLYVDEIYRPLEYKNFQYFHPAFLYEGILNLLLFLFLLFLFIKFKNIKKGLIFSLYLIFYASIRLLIENIRLDSVMNIYSIHVASIISIVILLYGLINLIYIYFFNKKTER